MKITKQGVLIIILIIGLVLAFSKYGRADSIICNDVIFTETSDIEAIPTSSDGTVFRGTIPIKRIKIYSLGAYIYLHRLENNEIYFNQMSRCMTIEDEVDSVKNLRWFLKQSVDARMSLWQHKR